MLFDVPNLDALSTDPADYREASYVLSLLASYSAATARAMELRAAGDIEAAQSFERNAQATYRKLPEWARW